MQSNKLHSDFDSIPEGLEFRQEYLDAALGKYRQTKRAILFKRLAYIGALALLLVSASVSYVWLSKESDTSMTTVDSSSTKKDSIQNTSPLIDLEKGEGVIKEHSTSSAVESVEATQDLSSRTTDQGDSMSSGVGLPDQLSITDRKVAPVKRNKTGRTSENRTSPIKTMAEHETINDSQQNSTQTLITQGLPSLTPPVAIAYLPLSALSNDRDLRHNHPTIEAPYRPWSVFAAVGMKLWADHGFRQRPFKTDACATLGIAYVLNPRWSGQFTTQFNTVSGVANPYVVEQVAYGQGFSSTTYRYYTDRFYEVGGGLGAFFKVSDAHSLGLGWSTRYLLTADNHIETGVASSFESLQETRVATKGYVAGYAPIRHSLSLSYEYALGKNKSIGARYEQGLTDITKNTYFGNEIDRNSMLSVYFRMKLNP